MPMTMAKRIRDCRYAKGWGPDELATRAEISRTALYQIECGKTETPRAGTLQRIAQALEVPIDALIGDVDIAPALSRAEVEPPCPVEGPKGPSRPRSRDRAMSSLEALDIIVGEAATRSRPSRPA